MHSSLYWSMYCPFPVSCDSLLLLFNLRIWRPKQPRLFADWFTLVEIVRCCGWAGLTARARYQKACRPRKSAIRLWLVFSYSCWSAISWSLRLKQLRCTNDCIVLLIEAPYCNQGVSVTGGRYQKAWRPRGGLLCSWLTRNSDFYILGCQSAQAIRISGRLHT